VSEGAEDDLVRDPDAAAMLYDHHKHVTSLCLFSLAGGVALADKAEGRWAAMLVVALLLIGGAGLFSFAAAAQVVEARLAGRPVVRVRGLAGAAPGALLSTGIGVLLYIFARSLK
jgi:hypothetical protein